MRIKRREVTDNPTGWQTVSKDGNISELLATGACKVIVQRADGRTFEYVYDADREQAIAWIERTISKNLDSGSGYWLEHNIRKEILSIRDSLKGAFL